MEGTNYVLRMNGGLGENSYANNSLLQQKVILMTRPIVEEAIIDLYDNNTSLRTFCIADLGCSSGPNTFLAISDLIRTVDSRRKRLRLESPEYHIFLNDLPINDFNTIFKSVPEFQEKLRNEMEDGFGPCFVTGVPGSFYQRLFPSQSLHFVHSSYSLHWLSQGLIEEEKLETFNVRDYRPSKGELKHLIEEEGSFKIDRLEAYEIHWNGCEGEVSDYEKFQDVGYKIAKCIRAVAEPLLLNHFSDEEIIEEIFSRYEKIINDPMSNSEEKTLFVNVTISLTKRI